MLTIFAVPKPFVGHSAIIQRNALQSWQQLRPACQIVLLGDDPGTAEAAAAVGALHVPEVRRNELGTPLVDSLFAEGQRVARFRQLCYVNADIVLLSDFLPALQRAWSERSDALLVGHRWNLDVDQPLSFDDGWEERLRAEVARRGRLHLPTGIDFFAFPGGLFGEIPPFAIGRVAWDGWLLYRAAARGAPIVDVTPAATVVHQNHDYSHHPQGTVGVWQGPEAARNLALAGGMPHIYTLLDASHRLTATGLRRRRTLHHVYRRLLLAANAAGLFEPARRVVVRLRSVWALRRRSGA